MFWLNGVWCDSWVQCSGERCSGLMVCGALVGCSAVSGERCSGLMVSGVLVQCSEVVSGVVAKWCVVR